MYTQLIENLEEKKGKFQKNKHIYIPFIISLKIWRNCHIAERYKISKNIQEYIVLINVCAMVW